jgi:hypothetical protein
MVRRAGAAALLDDEYFDEELSHYVKKNLRRQN